MKRGFVLTLWIAIFTCGLLFNGNAQQPSPRSPSTAANRWTLGIYTGVSPLQLLPPPNVRNPVLTGADVNDLNVDTLAHPFMIVDGSRYYMFFTAKDLKTDKGGIGMAESNNGLEWHYRHMVIHEPFILSHPLRVQVAE